MSSSSPTKHKKGTDCSRELSRCNTQRTRRERPRKVGLFHLEKMRLRVWGYLLAVCSYLKQRLYRRWS